MSIYPLTAKFTLADLRNARVSGRRVPMLTCYDYTTARLMHDAGVPFILVGDSAANVILGHSTTLPVSLEFMSEITAAVRRGAPQALLVADLPFGSYGGSVERGFESSIRLMKQTGADLIKIETAEGHLPLVRQLADAGVGVIAHMGLRPQSVGVVGGFRAQGKTADDAMEIVSLAIRMQQAGAVAILLEAVPPEVAEKVVEETNVPVIGCGAGPACHGHVVVTHDILGLTPHRPKFAPLLGDVATPMRAALAAYVEQVQGGAYPAAEHNYNMTADEKRKFLTSSQREASTYHESGPW
ncbi:MAG TPA: 3-methyl-2-oxobutanoate hydroxymethyltransferase [Tepidisphaeraceae bacterium]|jgi:3-methyl-2-oxobutanoate hydroxymethyltransferase|nr:3-methyl-2-oxobutanoate hydroxymethyltransferase [Tepidisphaeraceae bacterium]